MEQLNNVEKDRLELIQYIYDTADALGLVVHNVEEWTIEDIEHQVEVLNEKLQLADL